MKNEEMFLAMRNIFYGGEFSHWLEDQLMPLAALKEFIEAKDYFYKATGFTPPNQEEYIQT